MPADVTTIPRARRGQEEGGPPGIDSEHNRGATVRRDR